MIKLNRNLRTKPTKQILKRRKKSSPSLLRNSIATNFRKLHESDLSEPKKRKSGTKKKKNNNYINIIYNNKNFLKTFTPFTYFSSSYIPVFSAPQKNEPEKGKLTLKRRSLPASSESATADKKENKPLSNKQRRARLHFQKTYNNKQRNKKVPPKETKVTKAMDEIFDAWDDLVYKTSNLTPIKNKKRTTKKFKTTCSVVRAFLNGKLTEHKEVVVPKYFKVQKTERKTPEDFKKHLHWFRLQLEDVNYKPLIFNTKVDLLFFMAGASYTKFPSILLAFCWNSPKSIQIINNQDTLQFITEPWKIITGNKFLKSRDLETFDIYLDWALPHFKRLHTNLDSMQNFDDEVDVMSFLTFGVLRNLKEKGKSFSPAILNQEFFKTMMEELRKKHGYTI